jgi:hypothetical protein
MPHLIQVVTRGTEPFFSLPRSGLVNSILMHLVVRPLREEYHGLRRGNGWQSSLTARPIVLSTPTLTAAMMEATIVLKSRDRHAQRKAPHQGC